MSRDHRKLRVFADAHRLTLAIYQQTKIFPKEEWFGIRAQLRRAAVSVPSNIVEGSARRTTPDYLHFLHIALGSGSEVKYLVELSGDLGLLSSPVTAELVTRSAGVLRQLQRLVEEVEVLVLKERERASPAYHAGPAARSL
jgi:four helix bundle protein